MNFEVSEEAFDFANLILKNYKKHSHSSSKEEIKTDSESQGELIIEKKEIDPKEKYSLDYKKFEGLKIAEEEKKVKDEIDQNAYYQQMACSHDRRKERELFEKSTPEKLEAAEIFKQDGNDAIKKKEYDKAAYFYQKGLLQLDYTFPENQMEENRFGKIQEQLHFNMALTKYYTKDTDASLNHLSQVKFVCYGRL